MRKETVLPTFSETDLKSRFSIINLKGLCIFKGIGFNDELKEIESKDEQKTFLINKILESQQ